MIETPIPEQRKAKSPENLVPLSIRIAEGNPKTPKKWVYRKDTGRTESQMIKEDILTETANSNNNVAS